jgi:hypothetical protein
MKENDSLDRLKQDYPQWEIGRISVEPASGSHYVAYWAKSASAIFVASTPKLLRLDLEHASRHRELS